jgi:hypothetical protein
MNHPEIPPEQLVVGQRYRIRTRDKPSMRPKTGEFVGLKEGKYPTPYTIALFKSVEESKGKWPQNILYHATQYSNSFYPTEEITIVNKATKMNLPMNVVKHIGNYTFKKSRRTRRSRRSRRTNTRSRK